MSKQVVRVEIENGEATVSVEGVKGISCKEITDDILQELGTVRSSTPTKEMYEREQARTHNHIKQ